MPVASRLTTFVGMSRLKKHALMVIAEHMTEAEISHIKGVFEAIDTDRSGTLSISELQQALIDYPDIAGEIQKLMDGIDLDGDQSIDYNEFVLAVAAGVNFVTMAPKAFAGKRSCPVCAFSWMDKVQPFVPQSIRQHAHGRLLRCAGKCGHEVPQMSDRLEQGLQARGS